MKIAFVLHGSMKFTKKCQSHISLQNQKKNISYILHNENAFISK